MARIHQALEQLAGKQLPQGVGVHAGQEGALKKLKSKSMKSNVGSKMKSGYR